ncbi:MAG TPA: hypothetical protein VM327_06160 [Candidatus Thermoplasmatota archaeon]|nr:hypothetical protein [Candidatus Thermoplasmatota archaeon]
MRGLARVLVAFAAMAAVLLAAPASAHEESAASGLRADVARAGHEPDVVAPHTQWRGFLELEAGSNVTAAYFQVCRVGQACFAPPTPATLQPGGGGSETQGSKGSTFRFDTSDYLANGRPVDYEAGWRLGVTWLLEERLANGSSRLVRFPSGPDVLSPGCQGDAAMACAEAHYLAFDVPAASRPSPSPSAAMTALLVVATSLVALRRRVR